MKFMLFILYYKVKTVQKDNSPQYVDKSPNSPNRQRLKKQIIKAS